MVLILTNKAAACYVPFFDDTRCAIARYWHWWGITIWVVIRWWRGRGWGLSNLPLTRCCLFGISGRSSLYRSLCCCSSNVRTSFSYYSSRSWGLTCIAKKPVTLSHAYRLVCFVRYSTIMTSNHFQFRSLRLKIQRCLSHFVEQLMKERVKGWQLDAFSP